MDIDFDQAELVIKRIAVIAEQTAWQAGVGGMETAGHLVSYLADHPRDIEPLLRFGTLELPMDWIVRGSLTFHGRDGKIHKPEQVRRASLIERMRRKALATTAQPEGSSSDG